MYVMIEENPNCPPDERVFSDSGRPREVVKLRLDKPSGGSDWCEAAAVDAQGAFSPAHATTVEDSGAGTAWLIFGGDWGIRLRPLGGGAWSLSDPDQWGLPFLVLDTSGDTVQLKP
jgi:hypothetical protein